MKDLFAKAFPILLLLVLLALHQAPYLQVEPVTFSWLTIANKLTRVLLCILIAKMFLTSFVTIGKALNTRLKLPDDAMMQVGMGFIAWALLLSVLGHIGFLYRPPLLAVLIVSNWVSEPFSIFRYTQQQLTSGFPRPLAILAGALMGAWLIQACVPLAHGDPLYYHLAASWWWAKTGKIDYLPWLPWAPQGGLGEYFYAAFQAIIGERITSQIACQFFHALFGYVLTPLLVYHIGLTLTVPAFAAAAAILCLALPEEALMLVRAKNDGFLLFFLVLCLRNWLSLPVGKSPVTYVLPALFAVSIKFTALFFVLPVAIYEACRWCRNPERQLPVAVATFLPLALLIAARNFLMTGNPVFPAMNQLFHSSQMNRYLEDVVAGYSFSPGSVGEMFLTQGRRFLWAQWSSILAVLALLPKIRSDVRVQKLLTLLVGGMIVLCAVTGKGVYARFGFFLYPTLTLLAATGLFLCVRTEFRNKAVVAFLLLGLLPSQIDVPLSRGYFRYLGLLAGPESFGSILTRETKNYAMLRWVNTRLQSGYVFSFADNESYYLDIPLSVPENNKAAAEVLLAESYDQAINTFKDHGFTHVLLPPYFDTSSAKILDAGRFPKDFELMKVEGGYQFFRWKG